jgi:hypothetical protein
VYNRSYDSLIGKEHRKYPIKRRLIDGEMCSLNLLKQLTDVLTIGSRKLKQWRVMYSMSVLTGSRFYVKEFERCEEAERISADCGADASVDRGESKKPTATAEDDGAKLNERRILQDRERGENLEFPLFLTLRFEGRTTCFRCRNP